MNPGILIENFLRSLTASAVTDFFIILLVAVFVLAIISAWRNALHGLVHYTPNLLTSLGILGTFIGIVIGLLDFNVEDIDASIGPLLEGLKTAFMTSLAGMTLAIVFKSLDSSGKLWRQDEDVAAEHVGPEEIFKELRLQRETTEQLIASIVGDEESTLISQIRLLRSDSRDQAKEITRNLEAQTKDLSDQNILIGNQVKNFNAFTEELWNQLEKFAEMLSKSATEQVINALKEVISDFNKNLTEQFGENFKELNAAVGKLVEWQENYRVQLEQMGDQYAQGVQAITHTQEAVTHISEETKQIPVAMSDLKALLETTQHQLDELERHLEAFRDMRDKAVEAVPEIQKQMDGMVHDVSAAVKDAGEQIMSASESVNKAIVQGAEDFMNRVNKTNEGLVGASDHLANNSELIREQLESTVQDINNNVRDMIANMLDSAQQMNKTFEDSNDSLVKNTQQVQAQVVDGLENMQKRLEGTLESIFEAQTREMNKSFNALEEELKSAVGLTGEAVNEQLKVIDTAMQAELERVMTEMGTALATITGRFTQDYSKLVRAMSDVVQQSSSSH